MRREDRKGGVGTKLLLNIRLDQYTSIARHADKMIRLIGVNYVHDSAVADITGNSSNQQQFCTYLIKLKDPQVSCSLHTFITFSNDVNSSTLQECEDILQVVQNAQVSIHSSGGENSNESKNNQDDSNNDNHQDERKAAVN